MTTGLVIWYLGLLTSLYCFGIMNYIQYANRTRQNFPDVENSAGSGWLKRQPMSWVALIF